MLPLKVAGLGLYFPEKRETKEDFIERGIPEEAIEELGVYERRMIGAGEIGVDMEEKASKQALENAGIDASELDLIISAPLMPDTIGVPNSNLLQHRLGAKQAAAFDIDQACGAE